MDLNYRIKILQGTYNTNTAYITTTTTRDVSWMLSLKNRSNLKGNGC
jgi:hypothetical protein